MEVNVVNGANV